MKFAVRNFGMIFHADIDIKPLTVLVGPNNAGKTWLAYLFAGIFGFPGLQMYTEAYSNDKPSTAHPLLDAIVRDILHEGKASVDLDDFIKNYSDMSVQSVASLAPDWIARYLGTYRIKFADLAVDVKLKERKRSLRGQIMKSPIREGLAFGSNKRALLTARKQADEHKLYFYTAGDPIGQQLPLGAVKEFVANTLLKRLFQSIYTSIHIFPTERTTYVALPGLAGSVIHRLSTVDISEKSENISPIPAAVGDFLFNVVEPLYASSTEQRMKDAQEYPHLKRYMELSQILQAQILEGKLDFSSPEPGPGREILFQPAQASSGLEMSVVSSMVKELAPLVLYLRYLAQPRELIIIDEPEMNLHPEAQAKIIEFLAMLVNAGLHVLVTTHSPYMVDHLENLITASEHPIQAAKVRQQFFLQNEEAFISKKQVSVYLIDENKATNLFQEDGHIHWDTFSEVSERVIRLYPQLLEEPETEDQSEI